MEECIRLLGMMVDQHCTCYYFAEDTYYLDSQGLNCNADAMRFLAGQKILSIDKDDGGCHVKGHWPAPTEGREEHDGKAT